MTARKLDIFKLLGMIDNPKIQDVWTQLDEQEQRGLAPLVAMRWMSGTSDARQIMLLNEFVNPVVFSLGAHPHLLCQLLQVCSSRVPKRYYWQAVKSRQRRPTASAIVAEYWEMSAREVALLDPFPSNQEILQMADELGIDQDRAARLKRELTE